VAGAPGPAQDRRAQLTLPTGHRGRDPAWDGVAIIWFDDSAALRAATTTPEWDRAKADDGNFIAPGPVAFIVTTEHVIVA